MGKFAIRASRGKVSYQATFSQYLNTISRGSGKAAPGNTTLIAFFNSDSKTALGSLESSPHLTAHALQAYESWRNGFAVGSSATKREHNRQKRLLMEANNLLAFHSYFLFFRKYALHAKRV